MLEEWWARLLEQVVGPRQESAVVSAVSDTRDLMQTQHAPASRHLLWIDGVGAFLLFHGDRVTVGGPTQDGSSADLSLMANLVRQHAAFVRHREGYILEASGPTVVAGRPVHEQTTLHDKYEIRLGDRVMLKFELPSVLSTSARIRFLSDHRPSPTVDGVVLMGDTCLLGPGNENHIRCPDWQDSVLLFRRDGEIWCKSRMELFVGAEHVPEGGPLRSGDVVSGPDLRFRIEGF